MALSVVGRAAGLVGPGYQLTLSSSLIGPLPNPVWWGVQIRRAGVGPNFISAGYNKETNGAHQADVVLGMCDVPFQNTVGLLEVPVAAGAAVELDLYLVNSAFGNVDGPTTLTGWTWDATGGLYILVSRPANDTAAILSAVTTTFPRT